MNTYAIVKVLALCLGAVSVVTRTLPEQASEISARAAGGYGISNTPTTQDNADAKIDFSEFNAATDVNDLKRRQGTVPWDIQITDCSPVCSKIEDPERNPDDCKKLSEALVPMMQDGTVKPFSPLFHSLGNCAILWNSTTSEIVTATNQDLANVANALISANCASGSLGKQCRLDKPPYGHGADIFLGHPDHIVPLMRGPKPSSVS